MRFSQHKLAKQAGVLAVMKEHVSQSYTHDTWWEKHLLLPWMKEEIKKNSDFLLKCYYSSKKKQMLSKPTPTRSVRFFSWTSCKLSSLRLWTLSVSYEGHSLCDGGLCRRSTMSPTKSPPAMSKLNIDFCYWTVDLISSDCGWAIMMPKRVEAGLMASCRS